MTAKRTDANQADIAADLRRCGCSVQDLHIVGKGCPDLAVGVRGLTFLLEVKVGKGTLTDDEKDWHAEWRGQVAIVHSTEEALAVVGLVDKSGQV